MSSVLFDTYRGLGDALWIRPFVMAAKEKYDDVYVVNDFPDLLYSGTGIKSVYTPFKCKTQREWALSRQEHYVPMPDSVDKKYGREIDYRKEFPVAPHMTITSTLEKQFNIKPTNFHSLKIKGEWIEKARRIVNTNKPICFVRLPTVRKEWANKSRNGKMEYFKYLIERVIPEKYCVVSSLDLRNGLEWLDGDMPKVDRMLHNNELGVDGLLGLMKISEFCLSIQCNTLPICADIGTPLFLIYGGYANHAYHADPRIGTDKIVAVEPKPFCNCLRISHNCNKNIDISVVSRTFKKFLANVVEGERKTITPFVKPSKPGLLLSRMRAWRCAEIATNKDIRNKFNIITVDHDPVSLYEAIPGDLFSASYNAYTGKNVQQIKDSLADIIKRHNITHAIIAQKEHQYAMSTHSACLEHGVKHLWTEAFFGDKLIFDYNGLQYTPFNDLLVYTDKVKRSTKFSFPGQTREKQPDSISPEEVYKKYGLDNDGKYVVVFGQLPWDMSIKYSVNPAYNGYDYYIDVLARSNPGTVFLYKAHPLLNGRGKKYWKEYDNVKLINEGIDTLFSTFECFSSFSSTTIFEGLVRGKKFATMGFHFCNDDKLCIQMRTEKSANNIYDKLKSFKISDYRRDRFLNFILNHYTISMQSPRLLDKLLCDSDDFYLGQKKGAKK